ncbi:MAG: hypothetical protein WCL39_03795 [Armatimonadota bacterium]
MFIGNHLLGRLALMGLLVVSVVCSGACAEQAFAKPFPVPPWMEKNFRPVFAYYNTDQLLQEQVDAGTTAIFNSPNLYWFYDGKGIYNWVDNKKVYGDLAASLAGVERIKKTGIRATGHIPPFWETEILNQHPDWQWLTKPKAKPIKITDSEPGKNWPPPSGCWYSPFGDWYIQKTVFLAKSQGWDGQILDGFGGTFTACYCKYCKDGYGKDTGRKIPALKAYPAPPDVSDPEYRHYLKWRLEQYDKFVLRWMTELKKIKPDYAFTPWSTGPGRWWHWTYAPLVEHSDQVNRIIDAPIVELLWDFPPNLASNLLPSFTTRYYRGLTRENPAIMCVYFRSQGQQWAIPPKVENDFRLFTVMTNGCVPFVITYVIEKTGNPKQYLDQIKVRQPWTDGAKSVKWAAMLVSQNSRLLYGISGTHGTLKGRVIGSGIDTPDASKIAPGERRIPVHMESAVGVFRAAEEDHLPLDIITDSDIEDSEFLSQYKVLVLPNAACISDKASDTIRRFVARGGGLVALQDSSLYNDYGDLRKDFALGDLFGASYVSQDDKTGRWPNFQPDSTLNLLSHQITDDPVIQNNYQLFENNLDYIGMAAVVKPAAGSKVVVSRNKGKATVPFLVLSEGLKGRVAYFAADVGQSYYTSPYQYERKLLCNSLRWAASEKPQVEVTAPMCVQSTFYQQEGGKRTVVHLLNEINTNTDRALPEGNVSLREEIVPLTGIKVRFNDPSIKRVHLEPEAQNLFIAISDGGVEVTVPKLGLHSMVVAER